MVARPLIVIAFAATAVGCPSADSEEPPQPPATVCDEPELGLPDGSCIRPGVPADGCGVGFVHDGAYGCTPVFPAESCADGLVALPGETVCRPVAPCGRGKWGDIPVEATTVYVDGSYANSDSDGSAAKPYATITAAVSAAPAGALIAVTDGTYPENVLVEGKTVRLWGACPDRVEIVGSATERAAIDIRVGADGSEVHRVALRGGAIGLSLSGSRDVLVEEAWVHDNAGRGINIQGTLGSTSLRVVSSLIEKNQDIGIYAGADIDVEDTVVRRSLPLPSNQTSGRGINIAPCNDVDGCATPVRTKATIVHSVLDDNLESALLIAASDADVESTLVRNTWPQASDATVGIGISVGLACRETSCDPERGVLTVRGSVIEHNHAEGLSVTGGDATVENTVVRGTLSEAVDGQFGHGIAVTLSCYQGVCDPRSGSTASIRQCLVEQNHTTGIHVAGSRATIESSVVRDSLPQASDQMYGLGVSATPSCNASGCVPVRSTAVLKGSLVERNHAHGLFVVGADATIEGTIVRDTFPQASNRSGGRGITVQLACYEGICDATMPATATVLNTLVERSHDTGIFIGVSDAVIETSVVRNTAARDLDGLFGDGVAVMGWLGPATARLSDVLIESSARAGLANFGASASLGSTRVRCNTLALSGDAFLERDFSFEDRGGNTCGCPEADGECKMVSAGLTPPDPPGSP